MKKVDQKDDWVVPSDEVFDPGAAFSLIVGTYPDLRELLRALGKLRWENLHRLPLTFGVPELMELGRTKGWLTENKDGSFTIDVP